MTGEMHGSWEWEGAQLLALGEGLEERALGVDAYIPTHIATWFIFLY